MLHGTYGNARGMCYETGFNQIAEEAGMITIYPDGVKRSWADGRGITPADVIGVDDVAFMDQVVRICINEYALDVRRIFTVGFSSGGFLAQRLAVEFPGRFAAMAVVSALLSRWLSTKLHASCGLPAMFVHGTADSVIPYDGESQQRGAVCSAEESVRLWAECNGLKDPPEISQFPEDHSGVAITMKRFGPKGATKPVILYTIQNTGHAWPGTRNPPLSSQLGPVCYNWNATSAIWNFLSQFPQMS